MSYLESYAGLAVMVVLLYALRLVAYGSVVKVQSVAIIMAIGLAIALPGVWFFAPRSVLRPQPFVGEWLFPPVCWLGVLSASCFIDFLRKRCDLRHWYIRFSMELLVGLPVWGFIWLWICIILNWVSIE